MDHIMLMLLTAFLVMLSATPNGRGVEAQDSSPAAIPSSDVNDLLNKGMVYVYTMSNTFLDSVVQTNYLTKMAEKVDLSTLDTAMTSITTSWSDWVIYMIGFVVCLALGLVLVVVMLLACCCFPCCRCCGRCGAVNPKKSPMKGFSRGRTWACSIALTVVAAGTVVGVVAMYGTNEALQNQLKGALFNEIDESVDGITAFLDQVIVDLNDTLYGSYLRTEKVVFGIIHDVPADAIKALDNATGAVTLLNKLNEFAGSLETLQQNLLESEFLAAKLDAEAKQLETNLSVIVADVTTALAAGPCTTPSASCSAIQAEVTSAKVRVNFGVVNVTAAIFAVNLSLSSGLGGMISDSLGQLQNVEDSINSSVSSSVGNMEDTAKSVESDLSSTISSLNDTLSSIDLSSVKDTVRDVQDLDAYKMGTEIAYGVLLGLACVVLFVIVLNMVGMLMGCLGGCKSAGYRFLMAGTGFTLIFYWIFALLVAIFFIVGGPIHTEFCRSIINIDKPSSAAVLSLYNNWTDNYYLNVQQGDTAVHVRPFDIYSACATDAPFYTAFNVAQFKNITEITDSSASDVKDATDKFKEVTINLPNVTLTNPSLTTVLQNLDSGLSESNLNFTNFYVNTEGNITTPDLRVLAQDLDSLNDIALSNYADALRSLYNDTVVPMSTDRDELVRSLKSADSIVHIVSFSGAAATLTAADETIRDNGSYIVAVFVNATADNIYNGIQGYVTGVIYGVENNVARCGPLYTSLKTLFDVVCVELLYPLNGYWFGLGCCIFFLIPSIFLSVKLAASFKIGASGNCVKHRDSDDDFPDSKA